jgi:hypothetical protein
MPPLQVTKADLKDLKELYKKAVKDNKDYFIYKQNEIITSYAKYLIEYLESIK